MDREFKTPNIVAEVKVNRLRWAGHLAGMNNTRAPLVIFNCDPEDVETEDVQNCDG